jgi:hypothetical protein
MRTSFPLAILLASIASVAATQGASDGPADAADPTDQASLIRCLDDDYQDLLKTADHPQPLRDAANLLAETNQNTHWTNYAKAVELIRQHRCKAAVPLLMKYMVLHASFGSSHVIIPAYVDAIRLLTGEKIDCPTATGRDRQGAMDSAVLKLYVDWWKPNKSSLTTDLDQMSDDRLKFVASELQRHSAREIGQGNAGNDRHVSTQDQYEKLARALEETSGRREWYKEELSPRMTAIFLAQAGYVDKPVDDVTKGQTRVEFAMVPLLAALREQGQADSLDKITREMKQNNATLLTSMLALHAAGEDLDSPAVLAIYDTDTRLECRTTALLALSVCKNGATIVPRLVSALDDQNKEIRLAGLYSLRTIAPRAALPKLIQAVHDGDPADLVQPGIRMLGDIGGDQAADALVQYMEKQLRDGDSRHADLGQALLAFSKATHSSFVQAGAHPPDYYETQALSAISSWRAQHP